MSRRHPSDLPRVLTTSEAQKHGLSRSAVRHAVARDGWRPLARGVVLTVDESPQREDWIHTGLHLAGPHAALSGWDAAQQAGVASRRPPSPAVLILDRRGAHRRIGDALIRPTRRPYDAAMLPGEHPTLPYVPVVGTARAVADTALMHASFEPVRAMVTSSIQRNACAPADLVSAYARGPRAGSCWLRRAVQDIVDGAKSIAEAEAIDLLTRAQVPTFEVNVPIVDRHGEIVAVADILWRALRLIVEIDSREFHFSELEWKQTTRRHTFLTRCGFAVEHHPPSDVRNGGAQWAAGIAAGLRARAVELGHPYVRGRGPVIVPSGGHRPLLVA